MMWQVGRVHRAECPRPASSLTRALALSLWQVAGGTFSELNAVAVYLASQDKLAEAEACLTDAIMTTMGAFRMLSDISTVNGQFGRAAGIAELMDTLANTGDPRKPWGLRALFGGWCGVCVRVCVCVCWGGGDQNQSQHRDRWLGNKT